MLYGTNKIFADKITGCWYRPGFFMPCKQGRRLVVWAARLGSSLSDTLKTPRFGAGGSYW